MMKIVWRRGSATVREVYEAVRERRPIAYTTVMTTMKVLEGKGYLTKRTEGRAFRYVSANPEQAVVTSMVREFVDRVFDGASRPLLLHLIRHGRLSDADRVEILRLIKETK